MEDNIENYWRFIWMVSNTPWVKKCPWHFYEAYEWDIHRFYWQFVVIYLDDILIFSHSKEEHLDHVEHVLRRLHQHKLVINLEKCMFMKKELVFLGFVITQGTLKMEPKKVEEIIK